MNMLTRKRALGALATFAVLAVAGVAFAYFTSTGEGTGEAKVGTSTTLKVQGTSASTLYPGTSSTVSFKVTNSGKGAEQLGTIHLAGIKACKGTESTWTGSACSKSGTEVTACEDFETGETNAKAKDFYMKDVVANQDITGEASEATVTKTGTLVMNDLESSQDECKNVSLTLSFTS